MHSTDEYKDFSRKSNGRRGTGTDLGEFPRNGGKGEFPVKIAGEVPGERGIKKGDCVPGERGICNKGRYSTG